MMQFLPLAFWGVMAFAALSSLLESHFRPLAVIVHAAKTALLILVRHWRIAAALLAVFAAAPLVEAFVVGFLQLRGQPLIWSALAWQGITAVLIAWIATAIHGHALKLPERTPAERGRYVSASIAAGFGVFVITVALSIGMSLAVQQLAIPREFEPDYFAKIIQSLIFVPLALVRPALSLKLRNPVRTAFGAAVGWPFEIGVWVILLGLPMLAFAILGGDIVRAHFSTESAIAFEAAKSVFNVVACAWFETTTLLLLARAKQRFFLPDE